MAVTLDRVNRHFKVNMSKSRVLPTHLPRDRHRCSRAALDLLLSHRKCLLTVFLGHCSLQSTCIVCLWPDSA